MKLLFVQGFTPFIILTVISLAIILASCQSPTEAEHEIDHFEGIVSLTKRYATDDAILNLGSKAAELIENANVIGETSEGIPYAQFIGEEAQLFSIVVAFRLAKTNDEIESCELEEGAGLRKQIAYGKCVGRMLERGVCVLTQLLPNGNVYSQPWTCPLE